MQNPDKGSTPADNLTNPLGTRCSTEQNLSATGAEGEHYGISSDSRTEAQKWKNEEAITCSEENSKAR